MTTIISSHTATKPRKRWPWVVAGLLLLGGIGGGVYRARQLSAQSQTVTQTTTTTVAQRGEVRVSVSGPGTLEASATRTVGADLTATVGSVPAVGERVTKGQLLTTLTSDNVTDNVQTAQLNLSKAQASLDAMLASQNSSAAQRQSNVTQAQQNVIQAQQTLQDAQATLASQQKLHDIGAVSNQDLVSARSAATKAQTSLQLAVDSLNAAQVQAQTGGNSDAQNLRSARIAVQQAQVALETAQRTQAKMKVYAPINGVVSTVTASEGAVVTAGSNILTLLDDSVVNLPVQIDETQISGVKVGQQAEVTLDAYDGETFEGQVIRVSPGATQSSGISVFTATVQLPNPDGKLRSGMTAEAEIIQSQARGLLVPNKAIQTVRTRSYVQVPAQAGNADGIPVGQPERVRVQVGATDGSNTIITEGLEVGQEVIIPGTTRSTTGSTSSSTRTNQSGFGGPPPGGMP